MSTSFADTARILNRMIPELEKGLTKGQRVFRYTKKLAEGLTDVNKRFKFFSKEFSQAKKQITQLNKLGKEFQKVAKTTKQVKDVTDKILTKVPGGGGAAAKASKLSGLLGILFAAGVITAMLKLQEFQQDTQEKFNDIIGGDLSKTLGLIQTIKSRLDQTNQKIKGFELQDQRSRDRVYALEKQLVPVRENANNALYEARAGRQIVEGKIRLSDQRAEAARKLANDALHETRAGRQTIDVKIQEARRLSNDALYETRQNNSRNTNLLATLSNKFTQLSSTVNQNLGNSINSTIATLKADIASAKTIAQKAESKNTLQDTAIDSAVQTVRGLAKALDAIPKITDPVSPATITELRNGISSLKFDLTTLSQISQRQLDALSSQDKVLSGSISGLASTDKELAAAIDKVDKKAVIPDLTPIQKALNDKFDAFVQQNKKDLNIRDLKTKDLTTSELSKYFDQKNATFERQSKLTADQRFQEFERQNAIDLNLKTNKLEQVDTSIKSDINGLRTDLNKVGADITGLDTKIKEREKVDIEANRKLDLMIPLLSGLPLLPGRVADTIKPSIPTLPQINTEVGKAMCDSFNGGCGKSALNKQTADINNAGKANSDGLFDKLNAGANAGLLAGQQEILKRLGDFIPGGLSGKLVDGFKWLQIDRALNILTFGATVHNAAMLSGDIVQTLVGALTNVLTLILPKDEKGQPFNVGEAINGTVANVVKGIVGAENYTTISANWAKANRIYQAATNTLNSFMGLTQTILQASEMIAAYTGKIGNALKRGGVVLENAYGWMNPQPKFNRVSETLEAFQQTASTIQMVTQIPLDIISQTTELTTASTEFVKAIKEDDKPVNKAVAQPEPDELKAKEATAKTASQPNPFDFSDLFDGED